MTFSFSFTPSPRAARRLAATARLTALSGALLLGASNSARADSINVDFNSGSSATYVGRGGASDTGTVWNGLSVGTSAGSKTFSNLVNSTSGATGLSVTANFDSSESFLNSKNNTNTAANLLRDYIYTTSSRTVVLNGLTTGTTYNLYLYGAGYDDVNGGGVSRGAFTVGGITRSTTGPVAATTTLTQGEDYVVFNNVVGDVNKSLTITYLIPTGTSEAAGAFNGFQLETASVMATPEPSTWAMMFLGMGAMVLVTRRKRDGHSDAI